MRNGKVFDYKNVIEEPEVTEAITRYRKEVYRFEDAYHALIDTLAGGRGIKGSVRIIDNVVYYMYAQKSNPIAKTPRLVAIYTVTKTALVISKLFID